jgi:alkylation response protein AidB-like acyl-CoA dehydrogenase
VTVDEARAVGRATSFGDPRAIRFREESRRWLADATSGLSRADRGKETDADILARRLAWDRRLFDGGYGAISWPAEFGGRGLGPIEEYIFAEEATGLGAPDDLAGRVGRLLVGPGLMEFGTPAQQARFMPGILAVRELWCQGFSEPDAGSDLASLRTAGVRDGDSFVVTGQKIWSSFCGEADWCLLLVRSGPQENRYHNLSMLLMPLRQEGVEVRRIRQISGSSEFGEIFFSDAICPAEYLLGRQDEGWAVAMGILSVERGAGFTPMRLSSSRRHLAMLEDCPDCLAGGNRAEILGELRARIEVNRLQAMRAVEAMAAERDWARSHSVLKIAVSELQQDLSRIGLENACDEHLPAWRREYFSIRSATIAGGTSEINRNVIAERLLGLPKG